MSEKKWREFWIRTEDNYVFEDDGGKNIHVIEKAAFTEAVELIDELKKRLSHPINSHASLKKMFSKPSLRSKSLWRRIK
jgi:type III secretory pathway lipoprotein EscJ